MLDILRDYIQQTATPELTAALVSAHDVFDRVQLENYEQGFEELLMTNEDVDQGETLMLITHLTQGLLRQILSMHGIVLVDDLPVSRLALVMDAVLDLQEYDNSGDVLKVIQSDVPANEILAELLALVTDKSAEELMIDIDSVNTGLISRIKDLFTKQEVLEDAEEERVLKQRLLGRFQNFCKMIERTPPDLAAMLKSGMEIGLPFLIYANSIGRDLETYPTDKAAQVLLGMTLLSCDGGDNPRAMIKQHIDKFISSIDKITQIDIVIGQLLLGLNHYE